MNKLCIFLFFTMVCASLNAQNSNSEKDSISIYRATVKSHKIQLDFKEFEFQNLDAFQKYRKTPQFLPYAHQGNYGLPFHSYQYRKASLGVQEVAPASSPYFWNPRNIHYYQTNRAFTEAQYLIGAEEETYLKLLHTQNFGKSLNIAFNYHRANSEGFYSRQLATNALFNTSLNFRSKDSAYTVLAHFSYNNVENFENAGLFVPDTFDANEVNPDLISTKLRRAESIAKNHSYYLRQKYDLSRPLGIKINSIALEHEFHYQKTYRRYSDNSNPANSFYKNFYYNDKETYDSTYARDYYNTVGLSFFSDLISFHFKSRDLHFFQNFLIQEDLYTHYIIARSSKRMGNFNYSIDFQKGLSGYYIKGMVISSKFNYSFKNKDLLCLNILFDRYRPDLFLNKYRANHIRYDTNFVGVRNLNPELSYLSRKLKANIRIGLNQSKNYIYFDTTAQPIQYTNELLNPYVEFSNKMRFLSKLNLHNAILYQQFSNDTIMPLPSLISSHSIFYENIFFKNAMLLQIGFDFYWISEYEGYAYFPESNRFHLNNRDKKLGNTYQVDFFVNARINRNFKLGLKVENLSGENYIPSQMRIHDYAIPGVAYKINLSWALLN